MTIAATAATIHHHSANNPEAASNSMSSKPTLSNRVFPNSDELACGVVTLSSRLAVHQSGRQEAHLVNYRGGDVEGGDASEVRRSVAWHAPAAAP